MPPAASQPRAAASITLPRPADEDRPGLREPASDLLGGGRLVVGRLPRPITKMYGPSLTAGVCLLHEAVPRPSGSGPSQDVPRIAARSEAAACLSSGSLPFPHLGLWTHDGHRVSTGTADRLDVATEQLDVPEARARRSPRRPVPRRG